MEKDNPGIRIKKVHVKAFFILFLVTALVGVAALFMSGPGKEEEMQTGNSAVLRMTVNGMVYEPSELFVEKNSEVTFIVDGTNAAGCVRQFVIPSKGVDTLLEPGENVFEFNVGEEDVEFRCGMAMATGIIRVVDEVEEQEEVEEQKEVSFEGIPETRETLEIFVDEGESLELRSSQVFREIKNSKQLMYGYNEMIPGPVIRVRQGSRISVFFENDIDMETTIHWHGLRHDIKDDGVPGISQEPVLPGESHTYELFFPDAGAFWYHPHIREDKQQDLGLAGVILVEPEQEDFFNPVNKEEVLVLNDLLIENNRIVPHGEEDANFAVMGRFGNTLLLNGEERYELNVSRGDVVRFFVLNTANARPFNLSIEGIQMKVVGADLGLYEEEFFSESIEIHPAERYIVEAYFPEEGEYSLKHVNPHAEYELGNVVVSGSAEEDFPGYFQSTRTNQFLKDEIGSFAEHFDREPDYELEFDVDMPGMHAGDMHGMMHDILHNGIEWEDGMLMMNRQFTSEGLEWIIRDKNSGKENMDIEMDAEIGDGIMIRLFNNPDSMHPMQHPFHLHGQRFLVVNKDGERNSNMAWKDTVVVPVGSTVDILVDVTNPGDWMFHCHIPEHMESGMMGLLRV